MNSNTYMALLLILTLEGLAIIMFLYLAQLAFKLRRLQAPVRFSGPAATMLARSEPGLATLAADHDGVARLRPAVVPLLHSSEGGLPYSSRSS
jgi:hypothetical protein